MPNVRAYCNTRLVRKHGHLTVGDDVYFINEDSFHEGDEVQVEISRWKD